MAMKHLFWLRALILWHWAKNAFALQATFSYTGSYQTFTVPAGVSTMSVSISGAGYSSSSYGGSCTSGKGATVTQTLSVTGGQVLYIYLGGQAENTHSGVTSGGWNGGGSGYDSGSGGNGGSDIRTLIDDLNSRLVVAGGGGGCYGACGTNGGDGGIQGHSQASSCGLTAGGGGGLGSGGASGGSATPGSLGQGGSVVSGNGGSGGGGGYYGGGGAASASGGGGSSYVTNGGSVVDGDHGGTGVCTLTYSYDPSVHPTQSPTVTPTLAPTRAPTRPTVSPTVAPTQLYVFSYTGSYQSFTVPMGANSLSVVLSGSGYTHFTFFNNPTYNCYTGYGATVTQTLSVTPGQVLYIYVGGQPPVQTVGGDYGGFNGGGPPAGSSYSSGGNGASDIRTVVDDLSTRLVVAGGGGGCFCGGCTANGGNAGGSTGQSGNTCVGGSTGGGGGSQTEGGSSYWDTGYLGVGGEGHVAGGGGGGGGYYGGGGGDDAGGGGGSSLVTNGGAVTVGHVGNGSCTLIVNYAPTAVPTFAPTNPTSQPSSRPSKQPTSQPSRQPSTQPLSHPTTQPSGHPSRQPSCQPVSIPSSQPSSHPSLQPSFQPTVQPTGQPTIQPVSYPSSQPSIRPSRQPSMQPSSDPSMQPWRHPSSEPTRQPSSQPVCLPTSQPSFLPSSQPSNKPTCQPTAQPSVVPSSQPSLSPTKQPSGDPTKQPSGQPSRQPFSLPSTQPSCTPSVQPSMFPSSQPNDSPSCQPSRQPSDQPSVQPTMHPSVGPSTMPTSQPSGQPSSSPISWPTMQPSTQPSVLPTTSPSNQPSSQPLSVPSGQPSEQPINNPSTAPSSRPSSQPSGYPSGKPSRIPSCQPSGKPSLSPSMQPSNQPTGTPTLHPSDHPSSQPSVVPSPGPSGKPSVVPSSQPSEQPTNEPSGQPSTPPSDQPTGQPSMIPSTQPSVQPSDYPTGAPSSVPSIAPSKQPSERPSNQPITMPSVQPTDCPSTYPSVQPISVPSSQPSRTPTDQPTSSPSVSPTSQPSVQPGSRPSKQPTCCPSVSPSHQPSVCPSSQPSCRPSHQPSGQPRTRPTSQPSQQPLCDPTCQPSSSPSSSPSISPTTEGFRVSRPRSTLPGKEISVLSSSRVHHFKIVLPYNEVVFEPGNFTAFSNITISSGSFGSNYVVLGGSMLSTSKTLIDSDIYHKIHAVSSDFKGRSVSVLRDFNGDGHDDLIIGDPFQSRCYVLFGSSEGLVQMSEGFTIFGEEDSDLTGWSVSDAGDVNNDTVSDIIIGAPDAAAGAGAVYVLFGGVNKVYDVYLNNLTHPHGFSLYGVTHGDALGISVSGAGDVNNDKCDDFIVGALMTSEYNAGSAYVIYGSHSTHGKLTEVSLSALNVSRGFQLEGDAFSQSAYSVSGAGDVNGDGFDDVLIGSCPKQLASALTVLVYGSRNRTSGFLSNLPDGECVRFTGGGVFVSNAGDLNHDGFDDMLIGSNYGFAYQAGYVVNLNRSLSAYSRPVKAPTAAPVTHQPTIAVTQKPILIPPTYFPVTGSHTTLPSGPSASPTESDVDLSVMPSVSDIVTLEPSLEPSEPPSELPSVEPSEFPSLKPFVHQLNGFPTFAPVDLINRLTRVPNLAPTQRPSSRPMTGRSTVYVEDHADTKVSLARVNDSLIDYVLNCTVDVNITGVGACATFTVVPEKGVTLAISEFNVTCDRIDLKQFAPDISSMDDLNIASGAIISLPDDQTIRLVNLKPVDITSNIFVFGSADDLSENSALSMKLIERYTFTGGSGFIVIGVGLYLWIRRNKRMIEASQSFFLFTLVTDEKGDPFYSVNEESEKEKEEVIEIITNEDDFPSVDVSDSQELSDLTVDSSGDFVAARKSKVNRAIYASEADLALSDFSVTSDEDTNNYNNNNIRDEPCVSSTASSVRVEDHEREQQEREENATVNLDEYSINSRGSFVDLLADSMV